MHNRMIKIALLGGVVFAAPLPAMAQQLSPDYSAMGDGYGYGPSGSDEAPAAKEEDTPKAKRGGGKSKPRVEVTPYIEAQQVVYSDLKDGSDVLTYSTVAAGIDASIQTRRAEGQINLRYERMITYDDDLHDTDTVTGLARGSVALTPNFSFEAGGIAARSKVDGRGAAASNLVGNPDNVTQVYSVYAGPTFSAQAGDLSLNAAYRAGYTKVEDTDAGPLPAGQDPVNVFDDSVSQMATVSVGMQPGDLPIGWALSGAWQREDAGELDQRFEGKYARADVTVPIAPTLAVVGGVGYEQIDISERDALRDGAGDPVIGTDGRYVTDPSSPRLTAYSEDGVFWDAGLMWRPSTRTSFVGRYGHRYGSDTYTGSFSYVPNDNMAFNVSAYDTVTGFGSMINNALDNLPTSFRAPRNPLSGDLGGCAFSQSGGFCMNDALQTASSAAFRQRGITAAFSQSAGGWDTGIAVGYNKRKFLVSALGAQAQLDGVSDQNYFAVAYAGTDLNQRTRLDINAYGSYFDPGLSGAGNVLATGANAALYHQILRGLSASAAVGVDAYKQEDFDREITASALFGLRYSF